MNERNPLDRMRKETPFQRGGLVRFRPDMNPDVREVLEKEFDFSKSYRIFYVNQNVEDEGGDTAWIGPADASPKEIEEFDPQQYLADALSGQGAKSNIIAVSVGHLKALLN